MLLHQNTHDYPQTPLMMLAACDTTSDWEVLDNAGMPEMVLGTRVRLRTGTVLAQEL